MRIGTGVDSSRGWLNSFAVFSVSWQAGYLMQLFVCFVRPLIWNSILVDLVLCLFWACFAASCSLAERDSTVLSSLTGPKDSTRSLLSGQLRQKRP